MLFRLGSGLLVPTALLVLAGCASPRPTSSEAEAQEAVRQVLNRQQAAWNRGDLEGFMQGYWQSDSLRFASGGEVRYGWETTLRRYREDYPTRAAMGTLSFSEVDVRVLSERRALAFGRWRLKRTDDNPGGLFTLVFRRMRDKDGTRAWRIVHDHTSSR